MESAIKDLERYSQFLERYRKEILVGGSSTIETFQNSFIRLKSDFENFFKEFREKAPTEAPGFNIFYLLGVTRDEVRTHSRFLAELLKPSSSHGQGNLFLGKFIKYCKAKYETFPDIPYQEEVEYWNAFTEETVKGGRLDILVSNPVLGNLIVIENKVDAYEQHKQLDRYKHWMDKHSDEYPTQALIFLTIRGHQPGTSIDSHAYLLSYRFDIGQWLEQTLPEIQSPVVKETVRQYLEVVKRL